MAATAVPEEADGMTETNLWSVTTLIKAGLGTGQALVNWNARQPAETAFDKIKTLQAFVEDNDRPGAVRWLMDSRWQKSGTAATRGTDVHIAAEQIALGNTYDVEPHIQPYVDQYLGLLERHQPRFLMAEAPVYSPSKGYAGTTDGVMELDGRPLIFDIKTTDKDLDAKSRPPYPEVALQLAAYSRAELVGLLSEKREVNYQRYYVYDPAQHHEPMPAVDGGVCIVVSPYDCRLIPIRIDDEVYRCFLHVRECARWSLDISKRVIGPEITAGKEKVG